jgi:hypothetical protein
LNFLVPVIPIRGGGKLSTLDGSRILKPAERAPGLYSPVEMPRTEGSFSNAFPDVLYWTGRSELPVRIGEDCSLRILPVILWAFRLNEGDLLTVERVEPRRYRFESYTGAVRGIVGMIGHPWPYIEKLLEVPMAAVGPRGEILLPQEANGLAGAPGEQLRLIVEPGPAQNGFILEPAQKESISAKLLLEVRYVLSVVEGYIRVPEDLLSILGLAEGSALAYKTSLAMVDFAAPGQSDSLIGRDLTVLGPGGMLLLTEAFLRDLTPEGQVLLTAAFNPDWVFRLTHYVRLSASEVY